jgi:N-acetylglucosamine-6-phosphate deacetylase
LRIVFLRHNYMPGKKAYIADHIFTGEKWLKSHAVVVEDGMIREILQVSSLPSSFPVELYNDAILAPAFIDLQIYGAYNKLLAVFPETNSLIKLKEYCIRGGAAYCMPTVATNTKEVFYNSIDAVKEYWQKGGEGILGLHLEGPWINVSKRGAHIESLIHSPSIDEVREMLEYGKQVIKIITLAPEVCSREVIDLILSYDIIVSAGHSNALYEEAMEGFENGITAVTHLYNAMSPLGHRSPGLTGAAMDHPSVMASVIADGHHVDYPAIRIAKHIMKDRLFAITDAVTETTAGHYQHYLAGDKYEAAGILSGSALTMDKAVANLVHHAGIELDEALRMASLYPARVMRLHHELGRIEKGYKASMVVLDDAIKTIQVI